MPMASSIWYQRHHVIPMAMATESSDLKSHVAPQFDCLDERDIVVHFAMLMASYDAIRANGMT